MPIEIALVACQYPGGIIDRTPRIFGLPNSLIVQEYFANHPSPAEASLQRLKDWLNKADGKRPLIVTGDSIYIDATAGLFDPQFVAADQKRAGGISMDALESALIRAYDERNERNKLFPGKESQLIQSIDDHEIVDNWEPSKNFERQQVLMSRLSICRKVFQERNLLSPDSPIWGEHKIKNLLSCFIVDTRTERWARDPITIGCSRIMSDAQFAALVGWFDDTEHQTSHRIIVSPSILLPRRLATSVAPAAALRSDAWDGYPRSMQDMLAAVAERPELRCIFLSGDEHLPCVVRATVRRADEKKPAAELLSVHTGAMYSPYPFANSKPEDFSDEPSFEFSALHDGIESHYVCRILSVWFPTKKPNPDLGYSSASQNKPMTGQGFAVLSFEGDLAADPSIQYLAADGADSYWPG